MQTSILAANVPAVRARSTERARLRAIRGPEWVIFAFLVYATAIANILPVAAAVRGRIVLLNLCMTGIYAVLAGWEPRGLGRIASVIRDWLPLAMVLVAYREMGWFALPHPDHALESHWVIWDRRLLGSGARAAIEAFGPLMPSILEIAYSLVYTLAPFGVALLYLSHRRAAVDRFLLPFLLAVLFCYAQFPFWPSEPPRTVFWGQDLPSYMTVFRRFNLWMLGNYGIHTSVFPSAHVAGAFSAAFGMRQAAPAKRWAFRLLCAIAVLIAVATVYGRYHYLADASAGLVIAVLAALAAARTGRLSPAGLALDVQAGFTSSNASQYCTD